MIPADRQPFISVCIQTYQHASFIRECLDSVLKQETRFPYEIILGEDDSTDGTREICIAYAAKHPGIIQLFLRSERDKIYIDGAKTGRFNFIGNLRAARGKYIALVDGDDFWCDNFKLQKQVDFLEANPDCSMSFHNGFKCFERGKPFIKEEDFLSRVTTKFERGYLLTLKSNPFITSSCIFLRSNIDDMPAWFYDIPFLDYSLHIHNNRKGKIGFLPDLMSVYRIHAGGMWSSQRAPVNQVKLWRLYTIMASNLWGQEREAFLLKRNIAGRDLIWFFKSNLWEDAGWFRKELHSGEFPGDEKLLLELDAAPGIKYYMYNFRNYTRKIARKLIKGN